ncbi:hypothetical protein SuNHUV7_30760 (plasmid) [Pseudoseohaeicola sp. NH-UV-7]
MARKRYSDEDTLKLLREFDVHFRHKGRFFIAAESKRASNTFPPGLSSRRMGKPCSAGFTRSAIELKRAAVPKSILPVILSACPPRQSTISNCEA